MTEQVFPRKVDYVEKLDLLLKNTTPDKWYLEEEDSVESVWITTDDENLHTIALLDYNEKARNHADALFIVAAKNHGLELLREIKFLRRRVVDLLDRNTQEVERRIELQKKLQELQEQK